MTKKIFKGKVIKNSNEKKIIFYLKKKKIKELKALRE